MIHDDSLPLTVASFYSLRPHPEENWQGLPTPWLENVASNSTGRASHWRFFFGKNTWGFTTGHGDVWPFDPSCIRFHYVNKHDASWLNMMHHRKTTDMNRFNLLCYHYVNRPHEKTPAHVSSDSSGAPSLQHSVFRWEPPGCSDEFICKASGAPKGNQDFIILKTTIKHRKYYYFN